MQIENVPRWIKASVDNFINSKRGSYPMFVEGQDRKTANITDFFELRMDGPYRRQTSKSEFEFYVEINIEITSSINAEDSHRLQRMMGQALLMLPTCIPVYKYGSGADDDQSYFGDLQRIDETQNATEVSSFGQIDPNLPLLQGTVEAHYRLITFEE